MRITDGCLAIYHGMLARTGISGHSKRIAQYHRARALPGWGLSVLELGPARGKADLSIIIACFNYAEFLPAAIQSASNAAAANPHLKTEIIVFDDRSTDNSHDIATHLGAASGIAFTVIRPIWNVGLTSARNISLQNAQGDFVFFLDADNTMSPDGLKALTDCAVTENADAVYGPIQRIDQNSTHAGFISNQPFDEHILRSQGNYIDAMALFRRSTLLDIGGYDLELLAHIGGHEDHDLWLRLAATKAVVKYCADSVIGNYLVKNDSMAQSISQREYADGYRYMNTDIRVQPDHHDDLLVFDLGFHMGEDTAFYLDAGYRVLAVEADPEIRATGLQRFADKIESRQLVLVHAAAVGWRTLQQNKSITFHPHQTNSQWGTVDPAFLQRNADIHLQPHAPAISVPAISLERLVTDHGCPHLLKVDIEGMDAAVINDLERLAVLPPYVSWETGKHHFLKIVALHLRLYRIGYRRFRVVQQMYASNQFPAIDGPAHILPGRPHSSGPMPDTHPQPWQGIARVLLKYAALFIAYRLIGPGSPFWNAERHQSRLVNTLPRKIRSFVTKRSIPFPGWFDTHAALPEPAKPPVGASDANP